MMQSAAALSGPARVVILGNGAAAWMTAAAMAGSFVGSARTVTIVEPVRFDHGTGAFDGVDASLPPLPGFLAQLGLDEELLLESGASYSLGSFFTGWSGARQEWFLPCGDVGAAMGPVAFNQLVLRMRSDGMPVRLEDYSLAALAAGMGRFAHPFPDPRSPLSSLSYGLHLGLNGLRDALMAVSGGVRTAGGKFSSVRRAQGGRVAALLLDDGSEVAGDLFIDCSGAQALLSNTTAIESWGAWLPCDRAISAEVENAAEPMPCAHHDAVAAGWRRTIPLQGVQAQTLFYSSAHMKDAEAGRLVSGDPVCFEAGMRRAPWSGNVVAIGSSALMVEPLARTGLHLVQTGIERLLRLLPVGSGEIEAAEYNRLAVEEAERLRDFLILPYKANGRVGEPFWDACRSMDVPDSLAHKIALYESRGRIALHDGETFERDAWVAMFDGLNVRPRRYDPAADGIPAEHLQRHFSRMGTILKQAAASLPSHGDYLRRAAGTARRAS